MTTAALTLSGTRSTCQKQITASGRVSLPSCNWPISASYDRQKSAKSSQSDVSTKLGAIEPRNTQHANE